MSKYLNITSRAFLLTQSLLSQKVPVECPPNATRKLYSYRYINWLQQWPRNNVRQQSSNKYY